MNIEGKIATLEEAQNKCRVWKSRDERIVFTNGCFDILHKGHVVYLEKARALGDKLVVGLNSDESTRRLKGESRPISDESARAYLLAALTMTDLIVIFNEDTPYDLITALQPDVLVKGGDYLENEVVGRDVVRQSGGKVVIIPLVDGYSTTYIEQKIRNNP